MSATSRKAHFRISETEFPTAFVRHFRPVRFGRSRKGLVDYVLDQLELALYCTYATGDLIPSDAIWSLFTDERGGRFLLAGEKANAEGYVVTEHPAKDHFSNRWELQRRLTYRQKLSRRLLEDLLQEIRSQSLDTKHAVETLLECKLDAIGCDP